MTQVNKPAENSAWLRLMPRFVQAKLSGRSNLQAALSNTSWLSMSTVLRLGLGLLVGLWVARYLGPSRFGQLNYAIALTSLFAALASLGSNSIVIRELVKSPEQKDVLLGSAMTLRLIGSALAMLVVIFLVKLMRPGDTLTLWLVVLSAVGFILQSINVIDLYFQAKVESRYTVFSSLGAFVLMGLLKVLLISIRAPLIDFAWAGLGEGILTAGFLSLAFSLKNQSMRKWRPDFAVMMAILKDSWPLILAGISTMIYLRVDQVLIGQMLNDKEVGLYSAAARISEIWYFIPATICSSTLPALIASKKQNPALYFSRLQKLANLLVRVALVVAVVMTFLSKPIITLLYGHSYEGAWPALSVLIWSGIPYSFGGAWGSWMTVENRTGTIFLFHANAAVVNLLLNFILIPRYGIVGSAYATLISYWIGHTVLAAIMKSQHEALLMLAKALIPIPSLFKSKLT
jgi:polysaccharide transporter, PST family